MVRWRMRVRENRKAKDKKDETSKTTTVKEKQNDMMGNLMLIVG